MDEKEWLNAKDPSPMLEFLKEKVSGRKLRLFDCACLHRIPHLLPVVSELVTGSSVVVLGFAGGDL